MIGNMIILAGAVFIFTMIATSVYKDYKTGVLKKQYEEKLSALKKEYEAAVAKVKK